MMTLANRASENLTMPSRAWAGGVAAAGCIALYFRPGGPWSLIALFVALGLIAISWPNPVPDERAAPRPVQLAATVTGCAAFAVGRIAGGGHGLLTFGASAVVLNSLAAVAEEAFFRRFVYGLVAPFGPATAIAVSSVAFALVHVHTYGGWVVPIDLMAGALLGWQRWVTRTWSAPAVTHIVANLLALG
jgi:membrane protease YdiL (CAAX protease family)